jgi:excisionase family DNA binding protein
MEETPIFFPVTPSAFLKILRTMIEEVINENIIKQPQLPSELAEKTLLTPQEVCQVLRLSKPTLYELIKDGKLKGFKIGSRRYFARTDVEYILQRQY